MNETVANQSTQISAQAHWVERANRVLPAGGFGNFDPSVVIREGKGARVWDEDNNEYVDFLIGSGPMLVGHCHEEVMQAVTAEFSRGTTFFTSNARGIELAEKICETVACAERVRYVSTGGEADMYAMRLARAYTGRERIMKFEGGYHGMSAESLMSLAPSREQNYPRPIPDSAGIPDSVSDLMIIAPFNDEATVELLLKQYGDETAAIIVEPLQRLIPPKSGFLEMLRREADRYGIVLIFDEVVTGYRLAFGGAQQHYGVTPDLCTLGKVIGGGFPLAAIAGKDHIMAHFDHARVGDSGFTMQIGTLSGNPVAAAAGLTTLEILSRQGAYETLRRNGKFIMDAITDHLSAAGVAHQITGDPVLFDVLFTDAPVVDYRSFARADADRAAHFNRVLRQQGVLKGPSKFYISTALTQTDLDQTSKAIAIAAEALVA